MNVMHRKCTVNAQKKKKKKKKMKMKMNLRRRRRISESLWLVICVRSDE